jgi:hypothetical protein
LGLLGNYDYVSEEEEDEEEEKGAVTSKSFF